MLLFQLLEIFLKILFKEVEKYFGSYEGGKRQSLKIFLFSILIDYHGKRKQNKPILCIGFEGLKIGHEDIYSLIILNNILGGSMSSRLIPRSS